MEVFGYYLGLLAEDKKKYFTDDLWGLSSFPPTLPHPNLFHFNRNFQSSTNHSLTPTELESFSISPSYQPRGIGSLTIQKWLDQVDTAGGSIYVRATKVGRGLYEKFGFVQEGDWSIDLTKYERKGQRSIST